MPNAPKQFRPGPSKQQAAKQYDARRGSAAQRGYGARWEAFRRWYFSHWFNALCGCGCNQPASDLDHIEAIAGPHDERFYDAGEVIGLAHACHSRKTAIADGSFGHQRTEEGKRLIETLKREAARRLALIDEAKGCYA